MIRKKISKIKSRLYFYFEYRIIPSKIYIKRRFKKNFNHDIDFKNPKTYNEKLQWKKIYDLNPLYTVCSDKYAVREYVEKKIGKDYLIPLLFVTEKPDEIPFDNLKYPCVIKSNHGSSRNIFIYKKEEINREEIIKECSKWLRENYYYYGKEWQYKNIKPKIIIEKLMLNQEGAIPEDYKLHCFNGKVEFIQVDTDRFSDHKRVIFDTKWKKMPFRYCPQENNQPKYKEDLNVNKPKNLKLLMDISEKLSEDFDYVRVDLYVIKNRVYFGELTFTPEAGFGAFFPNKYDLIYGNKLKIKKFKQHR